MLQRLREEIEHLDTNLVRFNVKKESEDFVKKIREINHEHEPLNSIKEETKTVGRCCLSVIFKILK